MMGPASPPKIEQIKLEEKAISFIPEPIIPS